ncbi:MAG: phosphatidate cytidylyltransferase [Clostridia bacterium]|nr:phosphatidate cytidylyltransferase [Clostridia bacterium]
MKTRVITAAVAITAFILILFFLPPLALEIVLSVFCFVGAYEVLATCKAVDKKTPFLYISCLTAFAVPWVSLKLDPVYLYALSWLYMVVAFFFAVKDRERINFSAVAKGFFVSLLTPFMFTSVARIFESEFGKYIILLPWICVWFCDSGALFVGKAFGKKKLAPNVSPNKTVAGFIGGLCGGVLAAFLYVIVLKRFFDVSLNMIPALIFGAVGTTAGQLGDLAFSLIKREAGIKDYGKLFPGHGGVYDRFDSIIFAASFFELLCLNFYRII